MVLACVAIPLLSYLGMLLVAHDPMIEIPEGLPGHPTRSEQMDNAGQGCFTAVGLYGLTFLVCLGYKMSQTSKAAE